MSRPGVRGGIVSLTQTEIMLVLAVVILLLLLAKNAELGKVCDSLPGNPCAEILGTTETTAAAETISPATPDPEKEITETLVPGGGQKSTPPLSEESPSAPEPGDDAPATQTAEENAEEPGDASATQTARNAAGNGGDAPTTQTAENGGEASATRAAKNAAAMRAEKTRQLQSDNEELKKENAALRAQVQNNATANASGKSGDKIGFDPCWTKAKSPFYYFVFNITYTDSTKLFRITPHRDLQSGAEVVNRALATKLGDIINAYPREPVGHEEFLSFARKITAAQKRLYGNNECRLPVTINEEVRGETIKFIRDKAGFFPIYQ